MAGLKIDEILEYISAGAQLVGTIGAYGAASQQGEFDEDAYKYQASVARNQAEQSEERALEEKASASRRAAEQFRLIKLQQSRALAVGVKGGSAVTGNLAENLEEFEGLATYEALNTIFEGNSRAFQYKKQAAAQRTDARNLLYMAKQAKKTGKNKARSTLISGAGNLLQTSAVKGLLK